MAKQRAKATTQRRVQTEAKGKIWQEQLVKAKTWLTPATLTIFAATLPYMTGTNDLLLSSILLALVLSAGAIALVWNVWRRMALAMTVPEIALLAFVVWQWLTVAVSVYRWASLLEASKWTAFAIVAMTVRHLSDERNRFWTAVAFVGAVTLTALHGLREYAINAVMGNFGWRIFGPFLQPNLFGNFLLLGFFVALGIAFLRPKGWTFLPAFVALVLLVAMALTGSKGALLAWLLGLVAFGIMAIANSTSAQIRKRLWVALAVGLVALVVVAALVPPIRMRFETIWTVQAHSWMFRIFVWKATFAGALSKPIAGFGAGTFEWSYPQFTVVGFTRHAHNGFLQVAIESGFVGLTLLLAFFATLIFSRFAQLPISRAADAMLLRPAYSPVHWGCVAAIVAFCFHNLVETAWMTLANLLALSVICGVALTAHQPRWQIQWRWQVALLLPILVGLWHSVAVARGAYFVNQARGEMLPSSRLYWLETASEADPFNARHLIDRAILLEAWAKATGDEFRLKQALQLCDKAIRLQPTRSGNYKVKARILREIGNFHEAEEALRAATKFNRTDTEAILKLGELLEEEGKADEAMRVYRRLVELDKSPYSRYKPVDQWQDIFIAAGKIRMAKRSKPAEAKRLLSEAETTLKSFLDAYLPILKVSDPEAAESQKAFVEMLLSEISDLRRSVR
ncbi:MAG: O-antigen ligase family protein [Armatimonadota bacterium]|nr:O-antigen ligase family protein [Armatimonadota bacterium]MDW8144369.1 O-antigen ligase family protein [Armatimonadota bacterium]